MKRETCETRNASLKMSRNFVDHEITDIWSRNYGSMATKWATTFLNII